MKVLLIKTSSMGDVIHTFPALTDVMRHCPSVQLDWVVEEKFSHLAALHPLVNRVIPVSIRRWRRAWWQKKTRQEFVAFIKNIRSTEYEYIIDAQGLLKSVWIGLFAKGKSCGYDFSSARESMVSFFYRQRVRVSWEQHAVERMRRLFSEIMSYSFSRALPDYGLDRQRWQRIDESYVLFFHGTTWKNKHWPIAYWVDLARLLNAQGISVKLSWGTEEEKRNSDAIKQACENVAVLDQLTVSGLLPVIASAKAIVGVDTGLSHIAAALNVPTIALYGPTDPRLTGVMGPQQKSLAANFSCAPCLRRECRYKGAADVWPGCFASLSPKRVFEELMQIIPKGLE
jgi:heptosyltransferase-1